MAKMALCMNCNIAIRANRQYDYYALFMGPDVLSVIEEWIAREVTNEDCICPECFNLVIVELNNRNEVGRGAQQKLGHQSVCVGCGLSLSKRSGRRSRTLKAGHPVQAYIANSIHPRQIPDDALVCNACWQRALYYSKPQQVEVPDANEPIESDSSPVSDPVRATSPDYIPDDVQDPDYIPNVVKVRNDTEYVVVDGYTRTPNTGNHCFVPDCKNPERLRVPLYLRKNILFNFKVYVTLNARVCREHISFHNWDVLEEYQFTENLSLSHIGEMLDLLRTPL